MRTLIHPGATSGPRQELLTDFVSALTKTLLPTGCVVEFCCAAQRVNQLGETVWAWRGNHESDFNLRLF